MVFADDLFRKHLVPTGTATEALEVCTARRDNLNHSLSRVRMAQNESKREYVPALLPVGENRIFTETLPQAQGKALPHARHLGGSLLAPWLQRA